MRRKQGSVRHLQQRLRHLPGPVRPRPVLEFEYIGCIAAELPSHERSRDRLLIHHGTTADIHQPGAGFHALQGFRIDPVQRFVIQRQGQNQHVAPLQQVLPAYERDLQGRQLFLAGIAAIEPAQPATESVQPPRRLDADSAQPGNADAGAIEPNAIKFRPPTGKTAAAHPRIAGHQVTVQAKS